MLREVLSKKMILSTSAYMWSASAYLDTSAIQIYGFNFLLRKFSDSVLFLWYNFLSKAKSWPFKLRNIFQQQATLFRHSSRDNPKDRVGILLFNSSKKKKQSILCQQPHCKSWVGRWMFTLCTGKKRNPSLYTSPSNKFRNI